MASAKTLEQNISQNSMPGAAHEVLVHQAFKPPSANPIVSSINKSADDVAEDAGSITSSLERVAVVTGMGVENLPSGIWHAAKYDATHLGQTVSMVAQSAALGTSLKFVMSDKGPIGAIGGLLIGGSFLLQGLTPAAHAYRQGLNAKTDQELDAAGQELGDTLGSLGVNSVISGVGFKMAAGATGRVMEGERFDNYVVAKDAVWAKLNDQALTAINHGRNAFNNFIKIGKPAETAALQAVAPVAAPAASDSAATPTTAVDPAKIIKLTLFAQRNGSDELMNRFIHRIAKGANPLTDDQIRDKFGTKEESAEAIRKYLTDHGLSFREKAVSGRFFVEGTAANIAKAFGANMQTYEQEGYVFRGLSGNLSIKPEVAPHIKAVLGFKSSPHPRILRKSIEAKASPDEGGADVAPVGGASEYQPAPRGLQPEEIFRAYGLPDTFTGEGTVTGFISFGGKMSPGFTPWMIDRGIDPATFKIYNLSGEEPTAGPADIEDNIDATAHKAGAKKATTVMIVADNTDVGGADAVDAATFPEQGQLAVPFLSNSWGSWETSWVPEAIESMRDAYKRRLLKGYVTTAAAGDDGAGDGSPEKRQMVDNGAAFPEVAAVGASRLLLNKDGSYNSETPWNTSLGATGGGRSLLTLRPKWMIATPRLQPSLDSLGRRFDGRPVPDFVADGDRDTGMIAPTDEGIRPTGGSSVAAPLAVIMATYIAQERGKPLSWPRDLWRFGRTNPEVYNDITTGNNTSEGVKGYSAGQGYDLVTGWGSIRVQNMVQAYKALDSQGALYNALSEVPSYLTENQGIRGLFMNQETQVPGWIGPSALMTDTQSENYKKAMAASK